MLHASLTQAWPPFVLVAALLAIGVVAHRDGLFTWAGGWLEALPGPPVALFAASCLLLSLVTAILNLDTAVVFVTPVLLEAARRRGLELTAFLYASLFIVNASSLYLPGSNLTNLLVLGAHPAQAAGFAGHLFVPALAATLVTALGLLIACRRGLRTGGPRAGGAGDPAGLPVLGLAAALAAGGLTVAFANPALPVLALGVVLVAVQLARRRIAVGEILAAVSPQVLAAVFAVSVALGVLARAWHGPASLLAHASRAGTAAIAAGASVVVNNLPAAVMLSARGVPHPEALLYGLNLGPNLAVTGSLAAFLWWKVARQAGAEPRLRTVSALGIVLAPAAIAAALLVS